jgi:hypothetical protein
VWCTRTKHGTCSPLIDLRLRGLLQGTEDRIIDLQRSPLVTSLLYILVTNDEKVTLYVVHDQR